MSAPRTMLEEALAYAERGWPVFPCHPNDKRPLVPPSHPRGAKNGGLYLATTDERQIREWWRKNPDAMIGVPMGAKVSAFVVDLDPGVNAAGEMVSAADLLAAVEALIGQELPPTRTSATPRGGWHLLFRWIPPADLGGAELGNSPGALPKFGEAHCDVRGEGGYICVAPSMRRGPKAREEGCDGVAYRWLDAGAPIADAPAALIDAILRRGKFARDARHSRVPQPGNSPVGGYAGTAVDEAAARLFGPSGLPANAPAGGLGQKEFDAEAAAVRKYALAALDREAEEVARTPKNGGRNNRLNKAALVMGQLVAAGAIAASMVESVLEEACARNGLAAEDGWESVRKTIASGLGAGGRSPRDLSEIARKARNRSGRASGPLQPFDDVFGPEDYGLPAPPALPEGRIKRDGTNGPENQASSPPAPSPPGAERDLPNGRITPDGRTAATSPDGGVGARFPAPQPGYSPVGGYDGEAEHGGAAASPANAPAGGLGQEEGDDGEDDDEALNWRLAFFALTDLGNAERFVERFRDSFRWCPAIGWLYWDGRRWARDGADGRVAQAEHRTARAIQREAAAIRGTEDDVMIAPGKRLSSKIAAWGRTSESAGHLGAIGRRAAAHLEVQTKDLDADPWLINVLNGTLVVRRPASSLQPQPGSSPVGGNAGEAAGDDAPLITFRDHDPADLITKLAAVHYDPDAPAPIYDDFLAFVQPGEPERRFLHQWGGLSLTGDTSEQKLAFFYGKGKNGKSTLVDAWGLIAGDYGETVPIETFLDQGRARGAGQATPDLALLPGVRMLRTSEPEKGAKLAESLIKLVTGGEPIQARHLNKDFFKFYPSFKLTLSGNYRPTVDGTDEGIWRRVMLVPWAVTVPAERIDRQLGDKLKREASGIFNRLLDGLRDWLDHGLVTPEGVTKATEEYRSDSDPLGRFLAVCVKVAPGERVQSSEMHKVFSAWAAASGERAWTPQGLGRALGERGIKRKQSNVIWWLDVQLIKHADDFVDADGKPFAQENGPQPKQTAFRGPDPDDLPERPWP